MEIPGFLIGLVWSGCFAVGERLGLGTIGALDGFVTEDFMGG